MKSTDSVDLRVVVVVIFELGLAVSALRPRPREIGRFTLLRRGVTAPGYIWRIRHCLGRQTMVRGQNASEDSKAKQSA